MSVPISGISSSTVSRSRSRGGSQACDLPCVKEQTAAVALSGDAKAAIPVSVNELKVAAVAKGSDIDHAPSAVFRYGTRVVILVEMALQVEEGQRADGNEHR